MLEKLFEELKNLEEVEAIALGGSRAGNNFDEKSDYDVYLYITKMIPDTMRSKILSTYCSKMEIGNHFWEYEDDCILNNGIDIEILYRNLDNFASDIANVVDRHIAHNGYTTCMWHNLKNSKIIFDRSGRLTMLQKKYNCPYPPELKRNIIDQNMKLLRYGLPAFEGQILKAVKRNDIVSVNHRVTEFLASYFDIIFAINEQTHPGEKRLIQLCENNCSILPKDFRKNIHELLACMFVEPMIVQHKLDKIISELEKVIY